MYEIPSFLIAPEALPLPITTSEPGSFAYNTFKVRIPRIIDDIVAANNFAVAITEGMHQLREEITNGFVRPLQETTPDQGFWNQVSQPWIGHSWLQVPWYWAETYFYRRVLEVTGYFAQGDGHDVDPYLSQKYAELEADKAPRALCARLSALPAIAGDAFESLLHASLWGNRTDLSYNVANTIGNAQSLADERQHILVDDTFHAWDLIASGKAKRVAVIADNAGTELLMDLALIDFLLRKSPVEHVCLHLKPQPFFVSDAMPGDVMSTIKALSNGVPELNALSSRLVGFISERRLELLTHWFHSTCLFYFQLPRDLIDMLKTYDLVFLKGDVNYRRLLGDAHWPLTASFQSATAYFPTPLVSLRTLKSELVVGLTERLVERLTHDDPDWQVNGRRGLIQGNF